MNVFIAGIGIVSPLGFGIKDNLKSLITKQHGIKAFSQEIDPYLTGFPIARVEQTNKQLAENSGADNKLPRTALLSLCAASEAISNSGIDIFKVRSGFISATTVGGMDLTEQFFKTYINNPKSGKLRQIINHECGKVTDIVADYLGINTYVTTINTACSSSANSIILATKLIKDGRIDVAIAGGTDALTSYTLNGFNTLLLLDNDLCIPFDAKRKGLNLGEAAGYVVLVSEEIVNKSRCKTLCTLSGYANVTDSFHQTALSPNGDGPYASMSNALQMAKLRPDQISYINLHGTATPNNDSSEGSAVSRLFGHKIPVSSTKSYTGHTLGASGGIEAVFSILSLTENVLLPNLRFNEPIPDIGIVPVDNPEHRIVDHVLSNSFGFGGNCSSLLFSKL
jgi:3-oxoacyl-[acyl-carrier-protein] synthase I